jgi:hypothetical protein
LRSVEEQNKDGFPAHARHQSPFDGFSGDQSHGPAGEAFGRIAADHGDNALLVAVFQKSFGAGSVLFVKSAFQPCFLVVTSMRNAARATPQVWSETFWNGIVFLETLQAVTDLGRAADADQQRKRDQKFYRRGQPQPMPHRRAFFGVSASTGLPRR